MPFQVVRPEQWTNQNERRTKRCEIHTSKTLLGPHLLEIDLNQPCPNHSSSEGSPIKLEQTRPKSFELFGVQPRSIVLSQFDLFGRFNPKLFADVRPRLIEIDHSRPFGSDQSRPELFASDRSIGFDKFDDYTCDSKKKRFADEKIVPIKKRSNPVEAPVERKIFDPVEKETLWECATTPPGLIKTTPVTLITLNNSITA